jgi:hypothetical protein
VRVWGREYREELLLNVTVFLSVWGREIYRGSDTECYCVYGEALAGENRERNWY